MTPAWRKKHSRPRTSNSPVPAMGLARPGPNWQPFRYGSVERQGQGDTCYACEIAGICEWQLVPQRLPPHGAFNVVAAQAQMQTQCADPIAALPVLHSCCPHKMPRWRWSAEGQTYSAIPERNDTLMRYAG